MCHCVARFNTSLRPQQGITLIGLLASLALLAVLAAMAAPSLAELRSRSSRAAINNELLASLALARSEALRRRLDTIACPASGVESGCRSDGAWHEGWIVFADVDRDGRLGERDTVLYAHGPLPEHRLDSGSGRPRVRYAPNGMNRGSNLSIRLCQGGEVTSALIINNAGRSRLETTPSNLRRWRCPT